MKKTCLIIAALLLGNSAHAQSPASVSVNMHDGGEVVPVPARQLASWAVGTFLESVAVAPDGTTYVSNHGAETIDAVRNGRIEPFAKLPGEIAGILLRPDGGLFATGRVKGGAETVYAIDDRGGVTILATIPGASFLNGLTWLNDRQVLVADSNAGVVWRIDVVSRRAVPWVRDPLLGHADLATRFPDNSAFPAANGVKRHGGAVYVSNSGRSAILRIPVIANNAAGKVEIWARDIVADDFVIDDVGNAYVPTHPKQSVVRLGVDGTRVTIATPAQGITGPTAATFGPDGSLYVVGNAGIPIDGTRRPSALLRLDIGAPVVASPALAQVRQVASPSYIMITAPTIPGSDSRRTANGQPYLRFLEANLDRIAFGGQVKAPDGSIVERVYFVKAATPEEARALMERSPYFQNRVYGPLTARPLQGMLGGLIGGVAWPRPR